MARIVIPKLAHHVTQRGNARRNVFFTPQDRQVYLGLLQEYSEHHRLRILGYCLMTNHVHLVVVPEYERSLAKTMRELHGRYSRYRNAIKRGSGHLWQGRYYSCAFEAVRMASVMRYGNRCR
jgi:putative transposase